MIGLSIDYAWIFLMCCYYYGQIKRAENSVDRRLQGGQTLIFENGRFFETANSLKTADSLQWLRKSAWENFLQDKCFIYNLTNSL